MLVEEIAEAVGEWAKARNVQLIVLLVASAFIYPNDTTYIVKGFMNGVAFEFKTYNLRGPDDLNGCLDEALGDGV